MSGRLYKCMYIYTLFAVDCSIFIDISQSSPMSISEQQNQRTHPSFPSLLFFAILHIHTAIVDSNKSTRKKPVWVHSSSASRYILFTTGQFHLLHIIKHQRVVFRIEKKGFKILFIWRFKRKMADEKGSPRRGRKLPVTSTSFKIDLRCPRGSLAFLTFLSDFLQKEKQKNASQRVRQEWGEFQQQQLSERPL